MLAHEPGCFITWHAGDWSAAGKPGSGVTWKERGQATKDPPDAAWRVV